MISINSNPYAARTSDVDPVPTAPAFYAEPDYLGSHHFLGRAQELQDLSDWARPSEPTNLLLFEAVGGNGKSMLTWEWTTNHSTRVRSEEETAWAGRFWYSFYERGAIMATFCQRALAYMTGQPLSDFRRKTTAELREPLLEQLQAKPWLLILDGLERILVAYRRFDAAEVLDEEANSPTDKIVDRNPCDTIRDEDSDLLRTLAAAAPSKILISSRLTPRALLDASGQPITGAKRITLSGLCAQDAEQLLGSCGIQGNSGEIQNYLKTNCDNNPLVIGILGGLIRNFQPAQGNFDTWLTDPAGGAGLELDKLDLVERRNRILHAAIEDLSPASRQLLSTLALLFESVDIGTVKAFNPHLPPEPDEVWKPHPPETNRRWKQLSDEEKAKLQKRYERDLKRLQKYEQAVQDRLASAQYQEAPQKLLDTIDDLQRRGLLQYDRVTQRHDLHPVVRGVASGEMKAEDKQSYGAQVLDYFTSLHQDPYQQAETLEDLAVGLSVMRTLLKLGRLQQAAMVYEGELTDALLYNDEILSLLRPFFPDGWGVLPLEMGVLDPCYLLSTAANAMDYCGELDVAFEAYGVCLAFNARERDWMRVIVDLEESSRNLIEQNKLARAYRLNEAALSLATIVKNQEEAFKCRLHLFGDTSRIGNWAEAEKIWKRVHPTRRNWQRARYQPGYAEWLYARFQFWQGSLQEEHLAAAEEVAERGKNRPGIRELHHLRGVWQLEQGQWSLARASFAEAVRMAREISLTAAESEAGLALAKQQLGELAEPRREAERLAEFRRPAHRLLAELWLALEDAEQARRHALAAYQWAWADGEPFVHRYELEKTAELLQRLNVQVPELPPYDPEKEAELDWEVEIQELVKKMVAEVEAKKQAAKQKKKSKE